MDFCIVSAENLPKTPQAFQDYVIKYFRPETILGHKCFIAFRDPNKFCLSVTRDGMAPSHSNDLDQFTDGIPDNKGLCSWIHDERQKSPNERLIDDISAGYIPSTNPIFDDD